VKLLTWNLQHGGSKPVRRLQEEVRAEVAADVAVLTESAATFVNGPGPVRQDSCRVDRTETLGRCGDDDGVRRRLSKADG